MWEALFTVLIEFYNTLNPTVQTLIVLGVLYSVRAGVIQLPNIFKNKHEVNAEMQGVCPDYHTFLDKIRSERSKGEEVHRIKYFDTVYKQMCEVETVTESVKDIITDSYSELLDQENLSEKDKSTALQIYDLITDVAMEEAIGYLRKYVKHNGFTTYDDVGFQTYIHQRSFDLQKIIKKVIDRRYLKDQLQVDRRKLYDTNMTVFYEKIQILLSDLFIHLRAIAEESENKIKEIEKEKE